MSPHWFWRLPVLGFVPAALVADAENFQLASGRFLGVWVAWSFFAVPCLIGLFFLLKQTVWENYLK
jgi:hypothetical protein